MTSNQYPLVDGSTIRVQPPTLHSASYQISASSIAANGEIKPITMALQGADTGDSSTKSELARIESDLLTTLRTVVDRLRQESVLLEDAVVSYHQSDRLDMK